VLNNSRSVADLRRAVENLHTRYLEIAALAAPRM